MFLLDKLEETAGVFSRVLELSLKELCVCFCLSLEKLFCPNGSSQVESRKRKERQKNVGSLKIAGRLSINLFHDAYHE